MPKQGTNVEVGLKNFFEIASYHLWVAFLRMYSRRSYFSEFNVDIEE
jgi:hypothetical protein